jgi:hypothetical protein
MSTVAVDSLSSQWLAPERVEVEADAAEAGRALTERITAIFQER